MADNLGSGVSRILDPSQTGYTQVIWQQGKPPLDSELNLIQSLENDWRKQLIMRDTPSGWFGNETNPSSDFITNPNWSNYFQFGRQRSGETRAIMWAVVNGWLIPVTGTQTGTPPGSPDDVDTWNKITLNPPPSNSGDFRTDFVFLEVWLARVQPGSTTNKPSSSSVYRYGNVEGGYSFLSDDIQDPAIGFETTERVQVQYRIRVVNNVGLASYPDGFDPSVVKGQGAASTDTAFTFTNMRSALGDPGLWRAGDGTANNLGTVDGYCYAIPLSQVFRRNSIAWNGDPSPNLNGAFNRNPTATSRSGVQTFSIVPVLANILSKTSTTLTLTSAANIPLPAAPATPVLIRIGDELMTYSSISGVTVSGLVRGVNGTQAELHAAGTSISIQSGRPDGLFSDQIAATDVLDARHLVNPNGFDYQALLEANLSKLVKGQLHSNWKRSAAGVYGPFIPYQDKVSTSSAALGVTKIDGPDNIRMIYSDAAVQQKVEVIVAPFGSTVSSGTQPIDVSWSLDVSAVTSGQATGGQFNAGDVIQIPIAQFKSSVGVSDADQVRFVNDGLTDAVKLRLDGSSSYVSSSNYTVTPSTPGITDSLTITFAGSGPFPITSNVYITVTVQYGAGRGLSRRPDSLHNVSILTNSSGDLMLQQSSIPGSPVANTPLRTSWALLWSKYRNTTYKNLLPVTSESYMDLGSKTLILSPFRRVSLPATILTQDGNSDNGGQGLMPLLASDNSTPKWTTTDPLGLFEGNTESVAAFKNLYVTLPRHLIPGWGAFNVPILPVDTSTNFSRGVNFLLMSKIGSTLTDSAHNPAYVSYQDGSPSFSYAAFSTRDLTTPSTSTVYNQLYTFSGGNGIRYAGMRFFTDSRGLSRKGLELPPFYGVARLFAVYEAQDYHDNGSAFNPSTRDATGSGSAATNLLRQNFSGTTFWVEKDVDGDSTYILNADALDLTKSPNSIPSFASANYVIEASVFGFDRNSFDLNSPFKLILSRTRPSGMATSGTRGNNIGASIPGPTCVIPGPLEGADQAVVNYSRTPYMGDAFGSQTSYVDIGYNAGSLSTATAYQLTSTQLTQTALSRPNQKSLEVLASKGFSTTLGTGRLSGDTVSATSVDFRNVGYENPASYPPGSGVDPRPSILPGAISTTDSEVGGDLHGCTERLPLGALFRDKDFKGGALQPLGNGLGNKAPFKFLPDSGLGSFVSSLASMSSYEQTEALVSSASTANGDAGDMIVHVDGEPGNYSQLTNYRVARGGSAYCASGSHPGGEVYSSYDEIYGSSGHTNVLTGRAYLVRNVPTNVGSTEVSAGDELMLLIVTNVQRVTTGTSAPNYTLISTNGTAEGYAAADLYRIEGRPLVSDHVRYEVIPASITLSNRTT